MTTLNRKIDTFIDKFYKGFVDNWSKTDNNKRLGELDFVVEYKGNVLPIEVKSGKDYERHNTLTNVMGIKDYGIPEALVLCNDNIYQKGNITYMPIYMMMFLKKDDEVNVTYKFDLSGIKL
ncbi:hypothetical protein [uncultured Prevotella sp.]|uniref:hypothetical protein n=1 Tax=uncultured Prevotella sp. TaxID=159272 RepID=UPI00261F7E9F|nr:hypothetical protein [uncultured Prevotella sp.]